MPKKSRNHHRLTLNPRASGGDLPRLLVRARILIESHPEFDADSETGQLLRETWHGLSVIYQQSVGESEP